MDNSWKEIFKDYPKRNELGITVDNINKKRQTATIYPPKELVFQIKVNRFFADFF